MTTEDPEDRPGGEGGAIAVWWVASVVAAVAMVLVTVFK